MLAWRFFTRIERVTERVTERVAETRTEIVTERETEVSGITEMMMIPENAIWAAPTGDGYGGERGGGGGGKGGFLFKGVFFV